MDCHGLSDRLAHTTGFSLKKRSQKCELQGSRNKQKQRHHMNTIQTVEPVLDPIISPEKLAQRVERLNKVFTEVEKQRKPGILDQIQSAESLEAAHILWHEFLEDANTVSQKTINKATRLLETLEFPLA